MKADRRRQEAVDVASFYVMMGASPTILTQNRSSTTTSRLRGYKRILLAMDYTGTLCEIGAEECLPEIVFVLNRLSQLPQVTMALVTGCCGSELSRITRGLPPLWTISDHGRACNLPDGRSMSDWPSHAGTGPLESAWFQAEDNLQGLPVRLQRKRFGVAVHVLVDALQPSDQQRLAQWTTVCRSFGMEILSGRRTIEALIPGFDKRRALLRLSAHLRSEFRIYAGDDVSDITTLTEVSRRPDGFGIYVASPQRPEPGSRVSAVVDGPAGFAAALTELAEVLEGAPGI
jgi:trehalose 6-phosphate phosphatase